MNRVTVQQATQGLAAYLLSAEGSSALGGPDAVRAAGVAVGHDARRGSARFARVAAAALASRGIRVHLFSGLVPTPYVAAAVAHLSCAAGVMVTASHNTKEYNGYKVYWRGGSQIVPPVDLGIAAAIRAEEKVGLWALPVSLLLADDADAPPPPPPADDASADDADGGGNNPSPCLITDPTDAVVPLYYRRLVGALRFRSPQRNARAEPCVYTPLHGVGLAPVERAFREFGLPPPLVVRAQAAPDPDFPTVVFPNPEEGAGTWDLACEEGRRAGARLVLANDPDADRLAAAERDASAPGGYRAFSGNEIGLLLADWVWRNHPRGGGEGAGGGGGAAGAPPPPPPVMLASAVSSRALASVARREGFRFEQTLTGFKWLGTAARRVRDEEGAEVLFAFEEAIGYMFPATGTYDKDGVAAACAFAEMAAARYGGETTGPDAASGEVAPDGQAPSQQQQDGAEGGGGPPPPPPPPSRTLAGRLEELYALYGRYCSRSGYFLADPPSKAAAVFEAWRVQGGQGDGGGGGGGGPGGASYPARVGGMAVASVRDLGAGLDTARPGGRPALPWAAGDMMVTFELEDRARGLAGALTVRGSGTEPKLKYYAEVWSQGEGEGGGEGGGGGGGGDSGGASLAEAAVAEVERAVADELVRPEERGLKRQGQ